MTELLGKSKEELREICTAMGEPGYRGGQIYGALYAERKFDFSAMTNLPAELRKKLATKARITLPEVKQRFRSTDGSVRYLFGLGKKEEAGINTESAESGDAESTGTRRKVELNTKTAARRAA